MNTNRWADLSKFQRSAVQKILTTDTAARGTSCCTAELDAIELIAAQGKSAGAIEQPAVKALSP